MLGRVSLPGPAPAGCRYAVPPEVQVVHNAGMWMAVCSIRITVLEWCHSDKRKFASCLVKVNAVSAVAAEISAAFVQ